MFAKVNSIGLLGLNAYAIEVEIVINRGQPMFDLIGLPDTSIKESRERIKSALRSVDIAFPVSSVTVNLAPANTKKSGSAHDLAILVSLLKAMGYIETNLDDSVFMGEVSLSGSIRSINGVLPMVIRAKELGFTSVYIPKDNVMEASAIDGMNVYGVENVQQLLDHFNAVKPIPRQPLNLSYLQPTKHTLDFSDVRGQQSVKYALEVAACGGHNVLMIGSPGSGKSMLAKRMPSILPPMTFTESLETTKIHSIVGQLDSSHPIISERPFRSPHHTISASGLVGGGSNPQPGEISLAHNGLLFLDELAEFDKHTLEILRQPLEDQQITISRVSGSVTYPSEFMLIGAMNPCPCGYFNHPTRQCTCTKKAVHNYLAKISGPLLDRFDIHTEVNPVEFDDLVSKSNEESSDVIRDRVIKVRNIQNERFKGTGISCNARITPAKLQEFCPMTDDAESFLKKIFEKTGLSARAYSKILKIARTIADMDNKEVIDRSHIAKASRFRSLDQKYWNA
jgi:magnesium chelatase family protein